MITNPIIDNRILVDYSFAIELLTFIKNRKPSENDGADALEQWKRLHNNVYRLVKYQFETSDSLVERDYIIRNLSYIYAQ